MRTALLTPVVLVGGAPLDGLQPDELAPDLASTRAKLPGPGTLPERTS